MRTRNRVRLVAAVVVVLAATATVAWALLRGSAVSVARATRGAVVETVVSSGRVLAPAEITVGALVTSRVREVYVEEGATVHTGQLLVQLEDAEARAALEQAEAQLAQAQAGRVELAKLSEPAARSALAKAEATLADAKAAQRRAKDLLDSAVGTRVAYDDTVTALAVAEAQREAAALQLRAAGPGGSQSLTASAGVAFAKAQLERARAQLAHTRIESPVDGVVLARYVEPGDSVMIGSKALLVSRTGATRLVIEPDERNLARLAVGQKALASSEAFPDRTFAATVATIAPSVDPQRGTIEVHLAVPDPPPYLKPHMTVSVEVTVGGKEGALLVPRKAVRDLAGTSPYLLVARDGRIRRAQVTTGLRGDEVVEITGGLDETDLVVADETTTLTEGARVRPRLPIGK